MTINEWVEGRQAQKHEVNVIIFDETSGEGIKTTLDPDVVASLQHAEGGILLKLRVE